MILAGDIGGTKTLLALYEPGAKQLNEVVCKQYPSAGYANFSDLLQTFLHATNPRRLEAAALGVAGPVIDQHCVTTNLPWVISSTELQQSLQIDKAYLLNDLQATAYGMLHLPNDDFFCLNKGSKVSGNVAVIAAGTGLGEAILYHEGEDRWHPIATEGGHCEFGPQNALQDRLLQWLRERYPEHVSIERILSGPGISNLYQFLLEEKQATPGGDRPPLPDAKTINELAFKKDDPIALEALILFTEIYGAEAGNLALKSFSRGGVFIGGGIAPKILPLLRDGHFMRGFSKKGRFSAVLQDMPVNLSLNELTGLLGAAWFAFNHR